MLLAALLTLQALQLPPPPRGYSPTAAEVVVDAADVLSAQSVDRINRIALDVRQKSGGEMAVVTMPDIGLRAASDVSLEIGRQWGVGSSAGIGQRERNAGAVVLVVPKETSSDGRGHCFVSTGQGVEGFITDFDAASMCREATPYFQQRDYATGVTLIATRVGEEFAREFGFALDSTLDARDIAPRVDRPRRVDGEREISPIAFFLLVFIAMMVLSSMGRRRRGCVGCIPIPIVFPTGGYHRGGWGGGGFGGGFGGGGFGGFGGGGGFSGGGGGSNW